MTEEKESPAGGTERLPAGAVVRVSLSHPDKIWAGLCGVVEKQAEPPDGEVELVRVAVEIAPNVRYDVISGFVARRYLEVLHVEENPIGEFFEPRVDDSLDVRE